MNDADRALGIELRRGFLLMANAIGDRYGLPRVGPAEPKPSKPPASPMREPPKHQEFSTTY